MVDSRKDVLIYFVLLALSSGDPANLAAPLLKLDPQPPIELSSENRLAIKNNPETIRQEEMRNVAKQEERHIPWVGFVALSGAVALLLTAKKKVRSRRRSHTRDPKQVALKRFEAIRKARPQADQLYVALTSAVREYLEAAFLLKAKTQTTEEFLQDVAKEPQFDTATRLALRDFLQTADAVKFGQYQPSEAECEEAIEAAMKVVEIPADR